MGRRLTRLHKEFQRQHFFHQFTIALALQRYISTHRLIKNKVKMVGTPPSAGSSSPDFVKRLLKPWAKIGQDLSNSTFSKLYNQEEKPIEEKYNLNPELWEGFKRYSIKLLDVVSVRF